MPKTTSNTWYWYIARDNELFVDIDNYERANEHMRRRLAGAIVSQKLPVKRFHIYPSESNGHAHMIVELTEPMRTPLRFCWEMILHGDIYRAACNHMRYEYGCAAADILIVRTPFEHRLSDTFCHCEAKHNKLSIMNNCTTAKELRGGLRSIGFFGKPYKDHASILSMFEEK